VLSQDKDDAPTRALFQEIKVHQTHKNYILHTSTEAMLASCNYIATIKAW